MKYLNKLVVFIETLPPKQYTSLVILITALLIVLWRQ